MTYIALKNEIKDGFPHIDLEAVDLAYDFAKAAHEGQTRYSGEPYIIHPVEATRILLSLNPDLAAIQACLLHDVTEDTERTLAEIEAVFGKEVASLVEGLEKLAIVKMSADKGQDEKWKKMFLAMAGDVRIVFIKLSDRLHNMRTLEHVPAHKQTRIAKETLGVHAAIASRLGIYQLKSQLEDLCFRYLYPEDWKRLSGEVQAYHEKSDEMMTFALSQIEQLLVREGVKIQQVKARVKHLWSLHRKMLEKDTQDLKDIYDLFAIRVILPDDVENVSHLYTTLGLLHKEFLPLQNRFKDYVAVPKPNGYRSLHTTLLGVGGDLYEEPTEVQIRSYTMHREAELGVASHWAYKENVKLQKLDRARHFALHKSLKKVHALVEREPEIEGMVREWVEKYQQMKPVDRSKVEHALEQRGIEAEDLDHIKKGRSQEVLRLGPDVEEQLAWLKGLAESEQQSSEMDLYPDKIFVLTPNRDVIELPKGASPIDFAYAIHTDLGNRLAFAKVNGRIISLDTRLHNGDVVSVGTRTSAKPSRYWLSIAVSHSARAKIKNWFNKEDRELNVAQGRKLMNEQLSMMNQPLLDDKLSLFKKYGGESLGMSERERVLESVALGSVGIFHVLRQVIPEVLNALDSNHKMASKAGHVEAAVEKKDRSAYLSQQILITGESDLPVVLSACCKPKKGHGIIGYVTRGRAIRVHRQSCSELSGLEGDRFVSAMWRGGK
jgi:guanosine-3',5'-bis(diphosphate) 3'-pyrophosphohydrolase